MNVQLYLLFHCRKIIKRCGYFKRRKSRGALESKNACSPSLGKHHFFPRRQPSEAAVWVQESAMLKRCGVLEKYIFLRNRTYCNKTFSCKYIAIFMGPFGRLLQHRNKSTSLLAWNCTVALQSSLNSRYFGPACGDGVSRSLLSPRWNLNRFAVRKLGWIATVIVVNNLCVPCWSQKEDKV